MNIDDLDATMGQLNLDDSTKKRRSRIAYFVMIHGDQLGMRYIIQSEPITIGRSPECNIQLNDDFVSRIHCRIVKERNEISVVDLESTNGTMVNGEKIIAHKLQDGDQVTIGRNIFKFLSGDNVESAYYEEIHALATVDNLTGAYNRAFFEKELQREYVRHVRYQRPLSLMMIDLDHFKDVNDTHGHLAGDRILSQLGKLISQNIRTADIFCRYGGEELVLLMPEIDIAGAILMAERIRGIVETASFEFEELIIPITISIGIAQADISMETPENLVKCADERLYQAKDKGRNRTEPPPGKKSASS